jgi:hypothetical protein
MLYSDKLHHISQEKQGGTDSGFVVSDKETDLLPFSRVYDDIRDII